MSIFNLFRKPKPKATFGGHRASIRATVENRGVTGSPERLANRLQRLEKSVKRAEGERKESMEREIRLITEYFAAFVTARKGLGKE